MVIFRNENFIRKPQHSTDTLFLLQSADFHIWKLLIQSSRVQFSVDLFSYVTNQPRVGRGPRNLSCARFLQKRWRNTWNAFFSVRLSKFPTRHRKHQTGFTRQHNWRVSKLRFTVNDGRTATPQYRGLGSAFTTIFRQEGLRGLYKGVMPNAWGSGTAWGFYFLL